MLDDNDFRHLYVPPGFLHGFQALTTIADVCYRIDRPHDPAEDLGRRVRRSGSCDRLATPGLDRLPPRRIRRQLGGLGQASGVIRRMVSSRMPLARNASRWGSRVNFLAKSCAVRPAAQYSL